MLIQGPVVCICVGQLAAHQLVRERGQQRGTSPNGDTFGWGGKVFPSVMDGDALHDPGTVCNRSPYVYAVLL